MQEVRAMSRNPAHKWLCDKTYVVRETDFLLADRLAEISAEV